MAAAITIAVGAEPAHIGFLRGRGPGQRRVEVALHLDVGFFRDNGLEQLHYLGKGIDIALAREQLGRDREITRFG